MGGKECADGLAAPGKGPGVEAREPFGTRSAGRKVETQRHLGAVAKKDGDVAGKIEDGGTREAGVGEKEVAGDSGARASGQVDADADGRESDAGKLAQPSFARDEGDEGGCGVDDWVSGLACEGVAGAGRAQVGVAFAAGGEDNGGGGDASAGGPETAEDIVFDPEGAGGDGEAQADTEFAGAADEGAPDVGGGVGDRKDVAPVGCGGGDAEGMEESAKGVGPEGRERRLDETSVASKAGGKRVGWERVGEVASAAAGGEEFDARARKLFEEDDAPAALGGGDGGQKAGGSGADDGEVRSIRWGGTHGEHRNGADIGVQAGPRRTPTDTATASPRPEGVQHQTGTVRGAHVARGPASSSTSPWQAGRALKELSLAKPLKGAYRMGTIRHRVGRITAAWFSLKEQYPNAF